MKLPFPGIRSSAAARKEEEEKKSSSGTDSASRSRTRNNSGTKASSSNPAGGLAALGKAFMQFASTDTGKAVISGALTTGAGFAYDKVVFSLEVCAVVGTVDGADFFQELFERFSDSVRIEDEREGFVEFVERLDAREDVVRPL